MGILGPEILSQVVAAAQQASGEVAATLERTLGVKLEVNLGAGGPWEQQAAADALRGPGLVILWKCGDGAIAALLAEETGLLPAWYADPDPTGKSKLLTLAQELGLLLLPESIAADDFQAAFVPSLGEAVLRGQPAGGAVSMSINLQEEGGRTGAMTLVWPLAKSEEILVTAMSSASQESIDPLAAAFAAQPKDRSDTPVSTVQNRDRGAASEPAGTNGGGPELPSYAKSLLRIKVPLSVALASKRQPINQILELGAGSIIHFNKPCEEPVELQVNGQQIAIGETVKVGDKFGLRILSVVLPEERFRALRRK